MPILKYNLIGQIFGKLLVVSRYKSKSRGTQWLCKCNCGKDTIVYSHNLYNGKTKSCGCDKSILLHNIHYIGTKDISGTYIKELRSRAKKKNLDFNLSAEYLQDLLEEQNYRCALSGVVIKGSQNPRQKQSNSYSKQTASVDRINSEKGYIEGNVQWVHKRINNMKGNMTDSQFKLWCLRVVNHKE